MQRILIALALAAVAFTAAPRPIALADTPIVVAQMDGRAVALGKYFESHNCPLLPYVDNFITAADKYNIDYRLLPAISIHESTCGKRYPRGTNNPFGWHPIRTSQGEVSVLGFKSIPDAIDYITGQLANARPYAGKTIYKKLATYCPEPTYPAKTINYMNSIDKN